MQGKPEWEQIPMPDEAAMAQLAYSRWERAEAESLAEYVSRRRTVDLAALVRQVVEEELTEAEKAAIRLRYEEGLTPIEISRRLHVHRSVALRTLRRAEARIRRYLKYVVQYQYNLRNVPFLPLAVRQAMVVSAARYGQADVTSQLQRLRVGENLTHEAVCAAAKFTPERLRRIENGEAVPDAQELLRLSAFYGVSVDSILKGEPPCRRH